MSKYQAELYRFFTSEENFDAACDVVEQFTSVKEMLVVDFWKEVANRFKQEMANYPGWKIFLDDNIDSRYSKFCLYRDEFCNTPGRAELSICIEQLSGAPYYGVWLNNQFKTTQAAFVRTYLGEIKEGWKSNGLDSHWPMFYSANIDFNNMSDVRRLQPSKRIELIDELLRKVVELFVMVKERLEHIFLPV